MRQFTLMVMALVWLGATSARAAMPVYTIRYNGNYGIGGANYKCDDGRPFNWGDNGGVSPLGFMSQGFWSHLRAPDANEYQNYSSNCFIKVYAASDIDAALGALTAKVAAEQKTIEDLINKNYKQILQDPQFIQMMASKIDDLLKEKGTR